ncbi:MAG TPA: nucleoside kinase [Acidobacteriota bacterium]|jgi:uridine kinase|nr:nucleoside kinase [Acidobacteriota bacterium]HNR39527.1 nucleoside kinase [Acidobacteriota bacterium]HNU01745.1 nucleoside kinase [Acidobacteriota bacterium]
MNQSLSMEITFPDGKRLSIRKGSTLLDILRRSRLQSAMPVVAAKINNRLTNLRHKLRVDSRVEFIDCVHPEGFRVYQSSLVYLLGMVVERLFPRAEMKVEHSLSKGLYCELIKDTPLTKDELRRIEAEMRDLIAQDLRLDKEKTYLDEARQFFRTTGQEDKIRLFRHSNPHTIDIYFCNGYQNYSDCPLVPSTGLLNLFSLVYYSPGFILIMPEPYAVEVGEAATVPEFISQPNLFRVFQEYGQWLDILGLGEVGELNERVVAGAAPEIIRISEALHEKKIAQLADQSVGSRIVLIAGPSSSGKTTFAKRLADQLRVDGLQPEVISLDDYFLDREQTPKDSHGQYDFESIRALNIDLLHEHFERLLEGQPVSMPRYNFHTGCSEPDHRTITPSATTILLYEGIHAINPELMRDLPMHQIKRIYVSPLTALSMDHHNRIPTTDVRMLRRIVRDYLFRGYDALVTLQRWRSVRRGETAYIFPYQKDADLFFNSSLVYELAVLKRCAEPLLLRISTEHSEYSEARRLLKFLSYFQDIPPDSVPDNSILREFIGASAFRY